jgi:Zn finger protein HypA/HybF involved in hydrogenase expression
MRESEKRKRLPKLKECPFCGSVAEYNDESGGRSIRVKCRGYQCNAQTNDHAASVYYTAIVDAANEWNRRPKHGDKCNTCIEYIDGTAKCNNCGEPALIYDDRPVTASALWSVGWRGRAFCYDAASGRYYFGAGSADEEPTLYCPNCVAHEIVINIEFEGGTANGHDEHTPDVR